MTNKITLSEQIYQDLFHDITDQHLKCGQKLTLKVLKERFNVSHTPIREALTRLAEDGLVTYYSNCGVTVTEFTENDIQQIFQFVSKLDSMAIQFCKSSACRPALCLELEQIITESETHLASENISQWKDCSEDFHVAFYRHASNHYLNEASRRLRARIEVISCMYYQPHNIRKINDAHIEIFHCIQNEDFDQAADLMYKHLQNDMIYALKAYQEQ